MSWVSGPTGDLPPKQLLSTKSHFMYLQIPLLPLSRHLDSEYVKLWEIFRGVCEDITPHSRPREPQSPKTCNRPQDTHQV